MSCNGGWTEPIANPDFERVGFLAMDGAYCKPREHPIAEVVPPSVAFVETGRFRIVRPRSGNDVAEVEQRAEAADDVFVSGVRPDGPTLQGVGAPDLAVLLEIGAGGSVVHQVDTRGDAAKCVEVPAHGGCH